MCLTVTSLSWDASNTEKIDFAVAVESCGSFRDWKTSVENKEFVQSGNGDRTLSDINQ